MRPCAAAAAAAAAFELDVTFKQVYEPRHHHQTHFRAISHRSTPVAAGTSSSRRGWPATRRRFRSSVRVWGCVILCDVLILAVCRVVPGTGSRAGVSGLFFCHVLRLSSGVCSWR